jgi:cytochrome P450
VSPDPKQAVRWGIEHAIPRQAVRLARRGGDPQAKLFFAAETLATPEMAPVFDELRARGPMASTRLGFITAEHAVVREVLSSNDMRTGFPLPADSPVTRILEWAQFPYVHPLRPPSLLATEPPDHTRYRQLVSRVFTTRAVEALRGQVQAVADELLDGLAGTTTPVDLVPEYCARLPVIVIAQILGVPPEEHDIVRRMGTNAAPSLDFGLSWRRLKEVEASIADFDSWLDRHIERLRRNPGEDLMSKLISVRDEQGTLDEIELKSTAGLVLAAGFETTVNLIGNAIALFNDQLDQLEILRKDPDLWGNAVDEVLRFDPPVLLTARTSTRDTQIAGRRVPADSLFTTVLAGANRDPKVFTDPNTFDVTRSNARDHLSFSAGRHFCLGAALARMEAEIGLRSLYDRFPDLVLLGGRQRRETRVLRGFVHLPALLGARQGSYLGGSVRT